MFAWVIPLLKAIAAVPKIAAYVEQFAAAVTQWFVDRQTKATLAMIADAAALAAHADTKEARIVAAQAWQKALNRSRPLP